MDDGIQSIYKVSKTFWNKIFIFPFVFWFIQQIFYENMAVVFKINWNLNIKYTWWINMLNIICMSLFKNSKAQSCKERIYLPQYVNEMLFHFIFYKHHINFFSNS